MSANDVKVNINVSDNGTTNKAIKSAENLKKTYDAAAGSASKLAAAQKQAGTASSRALASSVQEYGAMRASGSGTGASARDFANQAQGLGGLVRLYATYAANVFAVGAAFRALREASGTEIIARGLDQMGAAAGRNLVGMSKQLVSLTDGAINFREAMKTVSQSTSAGLSSKQMQDLAVVASKASNALGIEMTDAISRLTRGIVKLEPELLDELGIFTKIGPATEKYALSVGKSVSALSDLERRQAFANAVLEEGKKKFEDIENLGNPYDKLLASTNNLATSGLNLVNKVLEPLARILSESPTALLGIASVLGGVIVKSALPAIGQLRRGLNATADESLKAAEIFKNSFGDKFQTLLEKRFNLDQLRTKAATAFDEVDKGLKSKLIKISQGDPSARTVASVNKELAQQNTILADTSGKITEVQRKRAQAKVEAITFAKEMGAAEKGLQDIADKAPARWDSESLAYKRYANLKSKATRDSIVANAAENAQIVGFRQSWVLLNQEVSDKGLKGMQAWGTVARGTLSAAASRMGQIVGSLGAWGQGIALVIGVFQVLDSFLTGSEKANQKLNDSLQATEGAIDTNTKTLQLYIEKKKDAFSLEAVQAFSNSIVGIADSLFDANRAFESWQKTASGWDNVWEDIFGWFGNSKLDKLQKQTTDAIRATVKTLQFSSITGGEKISILAEELGVSTSDLVNETEAYKKAVDSLTPARYIEISGALQEIAKADQAATQSAVALKESLTEITGLVTQLGNTTQFTSLEGKLGNSLVQASIKLNSALQDPIKSFAVLKEMAENPQFGAAIGQMIEAPKVSSEELTKQYNLVQKAQEKLQAFEKENGAVDQFSLLYQEYSELLKNVSTASSKLQGLQKQLVDYSKSQAQLVETLAKRGLEYQQLALKYAKEQAGIAVQRAKVGVLAGAGADTAKLNYDLNLKELAIQEKMLMANFSLQKAILDNTAAIQERNILESYAKAEEQVKKGGSDSQVAQTILNSLKPAVEYITKKASVQAGYPVREPLSPEAQKYGESLKAPYQALDQSMSAARADIQAKRDVFGIQAQAGTRDETLKNIKEGLDLHKQTQNEVLKNVQIEESLLGTTTESLIRKRAEAKLELNLLDFKQKQAELDTDALKLLDNKDKFSADYVKSRTAEIEASEEALKNSKKATDNEIYKQAFLERQGLAADKFNKTQEEAADKSKEDLDLRKENLGVEESRLSLIKEYGASSQEELARRQAFLSLNSADIKYDEQKAGLTAENEKLSFSIAQNRERQVWLSGTELEAAKKQEESLLKKLDLNTRTQESLTRQKNTQDEILEQESSWAILLGRQADETKKVTDLTNSLAGAFGEVGQSIGEMVGSLVKATQQFEVLEKQRKDQTITEEQYQKKSKLWALDTIGSTSKAFKKQMGEKTAGYKILTGVEKAAAAASAVIRMMELKDTISKAIATVSANAPAIISQFLARLGPFGWPLGIAAVAALGGAFSGGGSSAFSMTGEQRRETQGTGVTYVDDGTGQGTLARSESRGVWGDIAAKSNSVDNTLRRMESNQVEGLDQDSKTYTALVRLDSSFKIAAANINNAALGLSSSAYGTTSDSTLGGLFGSTKTTKELVGAGIQLNGTFLQLASGAQGLIKGFEQVKTTTEETGWLWGVLGGDETSTELNTVTQKLGEKAVNSITNMFEAGAGVFIAAAEDAGLTLTQTVEALGSVNLAGQLVDLEGMTLEEQSKELQNIMSSYLDDVFYSAFKDLVDTYAKPGEGAMETTLRVVDSNNKVTQAIKNMGIAATGSLDGLYDVTEALVDSAGSLDTFISQYNFFVDNFLTEEDKVALSLSSVTKVLSGLGKTGIKTKSQFAELVRSLDLETESGRTAYQDLMDIAPAFLEVANFVEKGLTDTISKFKNFSKSIKDYVSSTLLGSMSTLTPAQKYDYARSEFESTYALALSGDTEAQGKLTSVANSFLEASRTYNASSSEYTSDFNYVLDKLKDAETYSESVVSTTELQLAESETQTGILTDISNSSNDLVSLVEEYIKGGGAGTTVVTEAAKEAAIAAVEETTSGYTSSYKATELTESQKKFFDWLDSSEGSLFKDIRGDAISNTIPSLLAAAVPGLAGVAAGVAANYFKDPTSLSVFEADALAQEAMDSGLTSAIEGAVASGVSQDKVANLLSTIKSEMKTAAKDTSVWGDIFGTGSGNRDAAKSVIGEKILQLETESWKAWGKQQAEGTKEVISITEEGTNAQVTAAETTATGASYTLTGMGAKLGEAGEAVITATETTANTTLGSIQATSAAADYTLTGLGTRFGDAASSAETKLAEVGNTAITTISEDSSNLKSLAESGITSNTGMVATVKDAAIATLGTLSEAAADAASASISSSASSASSSSSASQNNGGDGSTSVDIGSEAQKWSTWWNSGGSSYFTPSYISSVSNDGNYSGTYYSAEQSGFGAGAYADGGYATGMSIVGENGPELVDFTTPGRVYTAEETFGMFNGTSTASQALIDEICELRREVQKLRQQQQEETSVLISATFDANKESADKISSSIETSTQTSNWTTTVQSGVTFNR